MHATNAVMLSASSLFRFVFSLEQKGVVTIHEHRYALRIQPF